VSRIRLYMDEDSGDTALMLALQNRWDGFVNITWRIKGNHLEQYVAGLF